MLYKNKSSYWKPVNNIKLFRKLDENKLIKAPNLRTEIPERNTPGNKYLIAKQTIHKNAICILHYLNSYKPLRIKNNTKKT